MPVSRDGAYLSLDLERDAAFLPLDLPLLDVVDSRVPADGGLLRFLDGGG